MEHDQEAASKRLALAADVLDGRPVDWTVVEASITDAEERSFIRHLRAIAAIPPFAPALTLPSLHDSLLHPAGADVTSDAVPVHWGHLRVIEKIGRGSFGDVYRAWDTRLDREVALKLLRHREEAASGAAVIEEGRLLARVRHPNIATVYGAERIDGRTGIWMELVEGETLADEVRRRGPLAAAEVIDVGRTLCDALRAVHDAGLLHRDIKPQNVLRGAAGRIVLMDFGAGHDITTGTTEPRGTPAYVAPEVLRGEPADQASDIYSLGVLLQYLRRGGLKAVSDASPDDVLDRVLSTAVAPDPRARFSNTAELIRALESVASARLSAQTRHRSWVIAAAVLMVALGGWRATRVFVTRNSEFAPAERVWTGPTTSAFGGLASFTADGRYMACRSAGETFALCDTVTGTIRPIAVKSERLPDAFTRMVSRDGRWIAYNETDAHQRHLALAPTAGGAPRVVTSSAVDAPAWNPWRWSHDSRYLLVTRQEQPGSTVAVVDTDTSTVKTLARFEQRISYPALSHSHRYLAYVIRGEIYVRDLGAQRNIPISPRREPALQTPRAPLAEMRHRDPGPVVRGPDDSPLWLPGDEGLLFVSRRSGVTALWVVPWRDGGATAEASLVRTVGAADTILLDVTTNGDVLYYSHGLRRHVSVANLDESGTMTGTATAVDGRGDVFAVEWSPDGRFLAYGLNATSPAGARPRLLIRDETSKAARELELPGAYPSPGNVHVRWAPDNRRMLIAVGREHYLVDTVTGAAQGPIFTATAAHDALAWSHDGTRIAFATRTFVGVYRPFAGAYVDTWRPPHEASSLQLLDDHTAIYSALLPTGETRISRWSFESGHSEQLMFTDRTCRIVGSTRTDAVVACTARSSSARPSLIRLDVSTGRSAPLDVDAGEFVEVAVRPDGRAVALTSRENPNGVYRLRNVSLFR